MEQDEFNRLNVIDLGENPPKRNDTERFGKYLGELKAKDKQTLKMQKELQKMQKAIYEEIKDLKSIREDLKDFTKEFIDRQKHFDKSLANYLSKVENPPAPSSILQNRDEHLGATSAAASSVPSRMSSRAPSPGRENGMMPLIQNALYSTKVLLKQETDKYPGALEGMRKHMDGPNTVLNRMKADHDFANQQARANLAKFMPDFIGISSSSAYGINKFHFEAKPEHLADDDIAKKARIELRKEFSKVTKEGDNLRHVVEALINRYNHKLTAEQFQDVLVSTCAGPFKDTIESNFKANDNLNDTINHIVKMYGNVKTRDEKITTFNKMKVDHKNYSESLREIWNAALLCYPEKDMETTTELAIHKALSHLPPNVIKAVSKKRVVLDQVRELNPEVQPMDYDQFMTLVHSILTDPEPSE